MKYLIKTTAEQALPEKACKTRKLNSEYKTNYSFRFPYFNHLTIILN